MRAVLLLLLLTACSGSSLPQSELMGRWVDAENSWVMFTPGGLVGQVSERARVSYYTPLQGSQILVEEVSGDTLVRNLWTVKLEENKLEIVYPGERKVAYTRSTERPQLPGELLGVWSTNVGMGKDSVYEFTPEGCFVAIRWIRPQDDPGRQRRVGEAGRFTTSGDQLSLSGFRRRRVRREYVFQAAPEQLVLTAEGRSRTYQRKASAR